MPVWLFLILVWLLSLLLSHTKKLKQTKKSIYSKLEGLPLSHRRLWLYSRSFLIVMLPELSLLAFVPQISKTAAAITFLPLMIINCVMGTFSGAAYDLLQDKKKAASKRSEDQ